MYKSSDDNSNQLDERSEEDEIKSGNENDHIGSHRASRDEIMACQFHMWYDTFRRCGRRGRGCNSHSRNNGRSESEEEKETRSTSSSMSSSSVTIRSIVIDLPRDFISYLLQDGVRLPEGAEVSSCAAGNGPSPSSPYDDDDDSSGWDDENSSNNEAEEGDCYTDGNDDGSKDGNGDEHRRNTDIHYSFLDLNASIEEAIAVLGGYVVPKLNWSAPKDATWMNGGSLKCSTAGDVYVLLKSSDFVMHDLLHAFDGIVAEGKEKKDGEGEEDDGNSKDKQRALSTQNDEDDDDEDDKDSNANRGLAGGVVTSTHSSAANNLIEYKLVLRKWCHLHKSLEFRCFVASNELVAISQRDYTRHYPYLTKEVSSLTTIISNFYQLVVRPNFELSTYVFDCYVDTKHKCWILDFNVWNERTDSLLFTWIELEEVSLERVRMQKKEEQAEKEEEEERALMNDMPPEMRIVRSDAADVVQCDPLASYRAPIDAVHLAGNVGTGAGDYSPYGCSGTSFDEFMSKCELPSSMHD